MKKVVAITIIMIGVIAFGCGCSCEGEMNATQAAVQSVVSATAVPTATVFPSATPSVPVSATPGPSEEVAYKDQTIMFEYYDVAEEKMVEANYTIEEGSASVETALEAVNKAYIEDVMGSEGVAVHSIVFSEGNIFIDFTSSIYGLNLGSGGEIALLDSIADAYLNNVVGAKAVFYTVDGGDYASGHIEIPKGEAYKVK